MTLTLANLIAYTLQLGVLAGAAAVGVRVMRLRAPLPSLRFWQAMMALSIVLPILQFPWAAHSAPVGAFTLSVSPSSMAALAGYPADAAPWLLRLLGAGATLRLLWLMLGLVRLQALAQRARPAATFDRLLADLSSRLQTRAAIAISDEVHTPATIGFRRPLILVPRRLAALPHAVQRAVIAHELIHVRRRDWLHTVAEECWCAMLWFHPAARLIASRLALARETVVDEAALLLTRDRRAYAEALIAFASPQPPTPGVTALIGRRQLSQRISLIAEEAVMTRRRLALSLAAALLITATATSAAVTGFPITRSASQATVFEPGAGVTLPAVIYEVKPEYTPEAMQKKIQGSIFMDVVVGETGDVTDVNVSKSLDAEFGLDDQAVRAASRWKFKPGRRDGKAVAVRVTIEMTFTLK